MSKEIKSNQSVLILGYGREGKAAYRYLKSHYSSSLLGIADRRLLDEVPSGIKVYSGNEYLSRLADYDVVIRSPGVSPFLPALKEFKRKGGKITTGTNIFFAEAPGLVIGITGTKGKSTTTKLAYEIVRSHYSDTRLVGNIGRPALDYLEGAGRETVFVMELSCHQLVDAHYSPQLAVILNITPEHLDYYPKFEEYLKAKANIVSHQRSGDKVVYNPHHSTSCRLAEMSIGGKFRFSLFDDSCADCFVKRGKIYFRHGKKSDFVLNKNEIPLLGEGNIENTLAAISVGILMRVPLGKIRKAVKSFSPLEHRLEPVGEFNHIRFYNDSLATTPEATIHALKALGKDVATLILGGYDRHLNFHSLVSFLAQRRGLKTLILFPETGKKIWELLKELTPDRSSIRAYPVSSMREAVDIAFKETPPGKICLLSPAAASFNMFRDYKERGELFKQCVREESSL